MDDDDGSFDPEIAAQMGFASFGAQGTSKKRKYNDASFIEGQQKSTTMAKDFGSGANNVQLGIRAPSKKVDQMPGSFPTGGELKQGSPSVTVGDMTTTGESQPRRKNKNKSGAGAPSGLAAFLSHGQTLPQISKPVTADDINRSSGQVTTVPALALTMDSGSRPPPNATGSPQNFVVRTVADSTQSQDYRLGVRNEDGDMVYFLPSFLEDPWKNLRQESG